MNIPNGEGDIIEESHSEVATKPLEKNIGPINILQNDSVQNIVIDSTQTIKTEIDSTEGTKPYSPKYYLVGGSFKAEKNAERYLQQLKKNGYQAFHLGKRGNFYIVGIGTYNTEEEASVAKRGFLTKNPGSGIWIYKE